MDPNVTLSEFIARACTQTTNGEHALRVARTLRDIADDLAGWIERGGFAPVDPRPWHERADNPLK